MKLFDAKTCETKISKQFQDWKTFRDQKKW